MLILKVVLVVIAVLAVVGLALFLFCISPWGVKCGWCSEEPKEEREADRWNNY